MTPDAAIDAPKTPANLPPSTAGMTTKVVKGSLWTLAGQVAPLMVSLVTTPFTIRLLGAEGYGVLILVGLIPTYLDFADFGMSMASTKFGSEAYGEGDEEKEGRVVRTAALIALMSSVPVAALLIVFAVSVIGLFNVPPDYIAEATLALRLAAVTFVINILCSIFNTPQLARLRMDLNTLINAVPRILGLIATPIVIYLGYGIVGAVTTLLIASTLNLGGHLIVSRRLLSQLYRVSIDRALLVPLSHFGGFWAVGGVAAVALLSAEKGVLATTASARQLAYYSIAFTLASMMMMLSASMIQSLLPAFSQLQTSATKGKLNDLFRRGIRLNLIWVAPACFCAILFGEKFLSFWAGPEFGAASTIPFFILLAGVVCNLLAYFPYTAVAASGRVGVLTLLYWAELLPYLLLVWVLTASFGAVGAAIAWSVRVAVDLLVMQMLAKRLGQIEVSLLIEGSKIFSAGLVLIPVALIAVTFDAGALGSTALLVATLSLYAYVVWTRILYEDEREWVYCKLEGLGARS